MIVKRGTFARIAGEGSPLDLSLLVYYYVYSEVYYEN
jgi:hypothetical protein